MTDNYRQRATKAEQENVRLRRQLAREPSHQWFVDLIRKHLGQQPSVGAAQLGQQVKQLKESRGPGVEKHNRTTRALGELWEIVNFSDNDTCLCGLEKGMHQLEDHSFIGQLGYLLEGWEREYADLVKDISDQNSPEEIGLPEYLRTQP